MGSSPLNIDAQLDVRALSERLYDVEEGVPATVFNTTDGCLLDTRSLRQLVLGDTPLLASPGQSPTHLDHQRAAELAIR